MHCPSCHDTNIGPWFPPYGYAICKNCHAFCAYCKAKYGDNCPICRCRTLFVRFIVEGSEEDAYETGPMLTPQSSTQVIIMESSDDQETEMNNTEGLQTAMNSVEQPTKKEISSGDSRPKVNLESKVRKITGGKSDKRDDIVESSGSYSDIQTVHQVSSPISGNAPREMFVGPSDTKVDSFIKIVTELNQKYTDLLGRFSVETLIENTQTINNFDEVKTQNARTFSFKKTGASTVPSETKAEKVEVENVEHSSGINIAYSAVTSDCQNDFQIKHEWKSSINNTVRKDKLPQSSPIHSEISAEDSSDTGQINTETHENPVVGSDTTCLLPAAYDKNKSITNLSILIGQTGADGVENRSMMNFVPVSQTSMDNTDMEVQKSWIVQLINTITNESFRLCTEKDVQKCSDIGDTAKINAESCPVPEGKDGAQISKGCKHYEEDETASIPYEKCTAVKFEEKKDGLTEGLEVDQDTLKRRSDKKNCGQLELFPPCSMLSTRCLIEKPVDCHSKGTNPTYRQRTSTRKMDNEMQWFPAEQQIKENGTLSGSPDADQESKPNEINKNQNLFSRDFKVSSTIPSSQSNGKEFTQSYLHCENARETPMKERRTHESENWDELYEMKVSDLDFTVQGTEQPGDGQRPEESQYKTPLVFICPDWNCRHNAYHEDIMHHFLTVHRDLPVQDIGQHSSVKFLLSANLLEFGKPVCSSLFALAYHTACMGKYILPLLVMTARIKLNWGANHPEPKTDDDILIIWLAGIVDKIFPMQLTLNVWKTSCESPECLKSRTLSLYPLSEFHNLSDILDKHQYIVIRAHEKSQLMPNGADWMCCQLKLAPGGGG